MAHPFQQRKLLVTVCKAEIGWDQPDGSNLQSGSVTLVAGPFRASTRSVPVIRCSSRGSTAAAAGASLNCSTSAGACGSAIGQLSWAPSLGGELFVLSEDCLLVSELVVGAELWGNRGGRWNSDALYAQAEICLDAAGQALLLSGRSLDVRLPLLQPAGQAAAGKGGRGGAAPAAPVLGVLALSLLLQPSDAEAAITRHLPVELLPRLLLDTTRLLPGAVARSAAGAAYVDPCVVFLRIRLASASGIGRPAKDFKETRGSSSPWSRVHRGSSNTSSSNATPGRIRGGSHSGGPGFGAHGGGLPGQHLVQELGAKLGAKLQAHMDRTMGHVGAFMSRFKPPLPQNSKGVKEEEEEKEKEGKGPGVVGSDAEGSGWDGEGCECGKGRESGVDHAAAEAVMSLLESNGFAVADNRRLSKFFWCKVSYEGQYHTSRLVGVSGGLVRWDETFVIAALRPVRPAPLEIELYGSNDSKSRGKVVCSLSVPLCDLVDQAQQQHLARLHQQRSRHHQQQQQGHHSHPPPPGAPQQQPRGQESQPPLQKEPQPQPQPQEEQGQSAVQWGGAAASRWLGAIRSPFATTATTDPASSCPAPACCEPSPPPALPAYNPDTWPRGRLVVTACMGGQGGGHSSSTAATSVTVTHGTLSSAVGWDAAAGGGAAASAGGPPGSSRAAAVAATSDKVRECRFELEVEVVDADPRASANGTQLLPWAQHDAQPPSSIASSSRQHRDSALSPQPPPPVRTHLQQQQQQQQPGSTGLGTPSASGRGTGAESSAAGTPGAGLVVATRQDSVESFATAAVEGAFGSGSGGSEDDSRPQSPPRSPVAAGSGGSGSGSGTSGSSGGDGVLSPVGSNYGQGGVVSLGAMGATDGVSGQTEPAAQPSSPRPPPQPLARLPSSPLPGDEDCWLPPHPNPQPHNSGASTTRGHVAHHDGGVLAEATPSPGPGLCSAAALAASACATLSIVCHDLVLELPPPPEAPSGGGGGGGGGGLSGIGGGGGGPQAQYAAAVSALAQGDYFLAIRCGSVWVTSNSMRVVGAGGGGGAAATSESSFGSGGAGGNPRLAPHLGLVAPLLKPSALVSMGLFRRTDTLAGKKVLNVRAMIGMMASEQLVGKLRLRASCLVPGRPATVCLPLKAERSGPRPCATVAWCRLTVLLSPGPRGLPGLLGAYTEPPTYPPVAMLQEGAVAGGGQSATLPRLEPSKRVDAEALKRRERRLLIRWVSESSPGVSSSTARKLVEDGRTEFNAGRTGQNWRRIARSLAATEPLKRFWADVQSWNQPGLTLAVAVAELALLAWPSRAIAVLLLLLAVHLVRVRAAMLPLTEAEGAEVGEGAAADVAGGGEGRGGGTDGGGAVGGLHEAGGEGGQLRWGEPPAMVEDIGSDPEPSGPTEAPVGGEAATAGSNTSGGPLSPAASGGPSIPGGSGTAPPPPSSAPSTAAAAAAAAAGWIFGSSPPSGGFAGGDWAAQRAAAAAAGGGGGAGVAPPGGGGGGGAASGVVVPGGSEVPKDRLAALRQQYDQLVYFGLRVQNVLDDIAGGMERMQALLTWRDPVATACFLVCLLLSAAALWTVGMRVLVGALLLYDLRPPRWRDPWLPPPANAFTHLPTRADLMM